VSSSSQISTEICWCGVATSSGWLGYRQGSVVRGFERVPEKLGHKGRTFGPLDLGSVWSSPSIRFWGGETNTTSATAVLSASSDPIKPASRSIFIFASLFRTHTAVRGESGSLRSVHQSSPPPPVRSATVLPAPAPPRSRTRQPSLPGGCVIFDPHLGDVPDAPSYSSSDNHTTTAPRTDGNQFCLSLNGVSTITFDDFTCPSTGLGIGP